MNIVRYLRAVLRLDSMEEIAFEFLSSKLTSIIFSRSDETTLRKGPFEISPEIKMHFEKKSDLDISVDLKVILNNSNLPFKFDVCFQGIFKLNRNVTDAELERIALVNCSAALFPFVREAIADITRRSGLPPLLLPSVNFVQVHNNKDKQPNTCDNCQEQFT